MNSPPSQITIESSNAFHPPACQPAYFDLNLDAWVFSFFEDVLAAFREPTLKQTPENDSAKSTNARPETSTAISHFKLNDNQLLIGSTMRTAIGRLHGRNEVDLVGDLIQPWSIALLLEVLQADQKQRPHLEKMAKHITGGAAELRAGTLRSLLARHPLIALPRLPEIVWMKYRQKQSDAQLELLCQRFGFPGLKSVFLGLTQTLPAFLSNAWLALFLHPDTMLQLRTDPASIPNAVEELLRYAGLVHTLVRYASKDVDIAGRAIKQGQRVVLKVASANHDPLQFAEPNRLLLDRRIGRNEIGQLALGGGVHSCVGAKFVRLAAAEVISVMLESFRQVKIHDDVAWCRGAVLSFPQTLPATIDWPH